MYFLEIQTYSGQKYKSGDEDSIIPLLNKVLFIGKWRRGVVVITIAQLYSSKSELRFCTGSNPARGVSEIRDGEDL